MNSYLFQKLRQRKTTREEANKRMPTIPIEGCMGLGSRCSSYICRNSTLIVTDCFKHRREHGNKMVAGLETSPWGRTPLQQSCKKIGTSAKLSQYYTCHSVRATTITTLHQAGVASEDIVKLTNHKRVASLSHYIDDMPVPQKRHCSEILARTMAKEKTTTGGSSLMLPQERPVPKRVTPEEMPYFKLTLPGLDTDDSDDQENQNIPKENRRLLTAKAAMSSLLPNATFNGSCVINVNFHQ